jgi:hypothetical protein
MHGENKVVINWLNLNLFSGQPLLAPIYRWLGLEDLVGFNTNYNIYIRYHLIFRLHLCLGLTLGPRGTKITGLNIYTLVSSP